ncbi:MAG: hypothetical protein PWP51_103 [Clostridiales bacterium]|nr:hypothetical protein [Clostridiales bacterium]MDN5297550.1 hypothetical protein [Clostridiales bacterium]
MPSSFSLSGNQLKLIAIFAMVIDHIGAVFFPSVALYRIIGRLTMPIMAYFIAEGYHYTKDVKKYMLRLLFFGLLTMWPYNAYFGYGPFNIMFSLLAGLVAIDLTDRATTSVMRVIALLVPMLIATYLQFDGQFIVVLLVYGFHKNRDHFRMAALNMVLIYIIIEVMTLMAAGTPGGPQGFHLWVQLFALLTLPLLSRYNGKKGPPALPRYLFYAFYPIHITLLLIIRQFFLS